jgi:hypothetical protein
VILHFGTSRLESTPEHPFWVPSQGWQAARQIEVGDEVLTRSGKRLLVTHIESKHGRFAVYNFEVEDLHTYFVGSHELLVHNADADGGCDFVSYGKNFAAKLRKHSQDMREAARKLGIDLPIGPSNPATEQAMRKFIEKVVAEGERKTGRYLSVENATFSKLGDGLVVRHANGEFITFLNYAKGGAARIWDNLR